LTFADGEVSSTSLLHNHVMKGAFGLVISSLGVGNLENIDAGSVFNDRMFAPIFILAGLILIILLFGFVYYFWLDLKNWHGRARIVYIIFYAVITFSLMKNIFDGGLFDHEAIVSLAFFTLLLFRKEKQKLYLAASILASYILINLFFYYCGYFDRLVFPLQGLVNNLDSTFIYIFCLGALYLLAVKENLGKMEKIAIAAAVICFLTACYSGASIFYYRHKVIDKNNTGILAAYEKIDDDGYEKIGQVGKLNFYEISPTGQTQVGDIADKYDILDNFYPITLPYQNCLPHGLPTTYKYDLSVRQKIDTSEWRNDDVRFGKVSLKSDYNGRYVYEVHMSIGPCLPRHINIIQEAWQEMGIKKFLIVNLSNGNENL
jgi:hypothetical protein